MSDPNKLFNESSQKRDFFLLRCVPKSIWEVMESKEIALEEVLKFMRETNLGWHGIKLTPTNILSSLKLISMWRNIYLPIT